MSIIIQRQRVTQLVQITSQIVLIRSLFKFENHTLVHRYFMSVFYLGDKDGLDVQQLRSNVLAVDATLSQAPSAKDLPVPGRSAVACSEPKYFRTFLVGLSGLFGSLTGSRVQRVHELKSTHELFFNISM